MTYGWAVLVILVVLAALYYSGVFKPQTVSRCAFGPEMTCVSFAIKNTTASNINVSVIVQHSQQQAITLTEISCVRDVGLNYLGVPNLAKQTLSITLDPGVLSGALPSRLCFDKSGSPSTGKVGESFAGKIFLNWKLGTTGYVHISEARISGLVEPS